MIRHLVDKAVDACGGLACCQLLTDGMTEMNGRNYLAIGLSVFNVVSNPPRSQVIAIGYVRKTSGTAKNTANIVTNLVKRRLGDRRFVDLFNSASQDGAALLIHNELNLPGNPVCCMSHQIDKIASRAMGDIPRIIAGTKGDDLKSNNNNDNQSGKKVHKRKVSIHVVNLVDMLMTGSKRYSSKTGLLRELHNLIDSQGLSVSKIMMMKPVETRFISILPLVQTIVRLRPALLQQQDSPFSIDKLDLETFDAVLEVEAILHVFQVAIKNSQNEKDTVFQMQTTMISQMAAELESKNLLVIDYSAMDHLRTIDNAPRTRKKLATKEGLEGVKLGLMEIQKLYCNNIDAEDVVTKVATWSRDGVEYYYTEAQWDLEDPAEHSELGEFLTSENIAMSNVSGLATYLHPSTFQLASKMSNHKKLGLNEMFKFAREVSDHATNLQSENDQEEGGGSAAAGSFEVDWLFDEEDDDDASTMTDNMLAKCYTSYRLSFKGLSAEGFNFPGHLVGLRESDPTGSVYGPWPILGLMHGAKRLGESYCERMGSIAGSIVTADRTRLDDKTLEILILLKMNKELYIDMEKMVEEGKVDIDFAAVPDSYFGDFEAV
jgi:hypothetical protein|tara:strand:- start:655 stop:2463 length:1809 start_codon:yes stop_codon:yes gene_type:complete